MSSGKVSAIIPAAGSGERLGAQESKPFLLLASKPVLVHTLQKFQDCSEVSEVVVVVRGVDLQRAADLVSKYQLTKAVEIVEGGARRQDSVYQGLKSILKRDVGHVLVHDAVRPFVHVEKIREIIKACQEHDAAILAIRPKDTIKFSNGSPFLQSTLDRSNLWVVQTPQGFAVKLLSDAFDRAIRDGFTGTDDASLVEHLGVKVRIVEGSYDNIKITTREDLELAELILRRPVPSAIL